VPFPQQLWPEPFSLALSWPALLLLQPWPEPFQRQVSYRQQAFSQRPFSPVLFSSLQAFSLRQLRPPPLLLSQLPVPRV
jgi:hypothetical protein